MQENNVWSNPNTAQHTYGLRQTVLFIRGTKLSTCSRCISYNSEDQFPSVSTLKNETFASSFSAGVGEDSVITHNFKLVEFSVT